MVLEPKFIPKEMTMISLREDPEMPVLNIPGQG